MPFLRDFRQNAHSKFGTIGARTCLNGIRNLDTRGVAPNLVRETNRITGGMASTESKTAEFPGIDDDDCVLPADTMLILQQFLQEKALKERSDDAGLEADGCFEENWQLSQFWYNESTKQKLALIVKILRENSMKTEKHFKVALLSAPSAYKHVHAVHEDVILFEYDERFAKFGDKFRKYDYNEACNPEYMEEFRNEFNLIIADPPFLSEECIEKIGVIIKKIAKEDGKVVLCSGAVVQDWAKEHLDVNVCNFRPEHERNLGNEFRSYANFDLDGILNKAS